MNQLRISFIVSCYNIEKYISECLDSLLRQDLAHFEYEIICVDDCSTDATLSILKEYEQKYNNIIIERHKVNKKLGATRNSGRHIAKGKYVWFVDGDDMVKPNVLKKLLFICENHDLDELLFNHDRVTKDLFFIDEDTTFMQSEICTGLKYVHRYFPNQLSKLSIVWNHIYKNEFLRVNNFCSPEINMGEDGPFAWQTLLNAEKVMSISDSCYLYRCNDFSMTAEFKNKPSVVKLFEKSFASQKEVAILLREFEGRDSVVASDLSNIISWGVNSFRSIILEEYNAQDAKEFYFYTRSRSDVFEYLSQFLTMNNIGFANSLRKTYVNFYLWRVAEILRNKIKKYI